MLIIACLMPKKQLMSSSPAIQASHALYQADVLQAESLQKITLS